MEERQCRRPLQFTSTVRSHSSVCTFAIMVKYITPAHETRISMGPSCSLAIRMSDSTSVFEVTSVLWMRTLLPWGTSFDLRLSRAGVRRAARAMCAPSLARAVATAAPIPDEAPVTTATSPLRGPFLMGWTDVLDWFRRGGCASHPRPHQ